MSDLILIKRALISVSDKTGLADFATALVREFKVELISTGGTAKFLRELGLSVTDVSSVTGFPEMMDGRVKTLHPKIHGGLLSLRDNPEHAAAMKEHGISPIDLVCINLYPFQQTIEKPGVSFEEAIENIDIGGPSMIRSAAKNHRFVLVVTSPDRYEKVLGDLREHNGSCCGKHRLKQAQRAFQHTAEYDALIQKYLATKIEDKSKPATGSGVSKFIAEPHEGTIALAMEDAEPPAETPRRKRLIQQLRRHAGESLPAFLKDLITAQAMVVAGTEACAFKLENGGALSLIAHVRPDDASQEIRAQAIAAFREIVAPCISQEKNGAIRIEGTELARKDPQYCFVTLLYTNDVLTAVSAVIARCQDEERARQRLNSMELVAGYFDMFAETRGLMQQHSTQPQAESPLPDSFSISLSKKQSLRYGENPHQPAALYVGDKTNEASVAHATQHHGKELSYINLLDADAALSVVKEFTTPAACIVKHATPCGCATAEHLSTAFLRAYEGDPLAAFGGIVALNQVIDLSVAQAITAIDKLLEVIVAPGYAPDALDLLKSRWKNVRLLEVGGRLQPDRSDLSMHKIVGGFLVQQRDLTGLNEDEWKIVSKRQPTKDELADLRVAWLVCKHVKSNAIVLGKDRSAVGIGGGQVDRVNAARIAVQKAGERAQGAVAASDAFFPFPDGPKLLLDAGVKAIIHPGGSLKDQESIDVADAAGAVMILTHQRHFRH